MPNKKIHIKVGAVVGATVASGASIMKELHRVETIPGYKFDFIKVGLDTLMGGLAGGTFGALPDILEPASNPHHRQFFHSKVTGLILLRIMATVVNNNQGKISKPLTLAGGAGYISHLVLDAQTPMGLPII